MKLCFLAAANSIHSYKWIKYFADKGYEIHWVSLSTSIYEPIKNVHFYDLSLSRSKARAIVTAVRLVKKLAKTNKFELLHAHYAGTYGLVGALSGFHPFVITAWGSDVLIAGKSLLKKPLVKYILNKADLITCDAEHIKKAMLEIEPSIANIDIIYFGIDVNKFKLYERNQNLRNNLGISKYPAVISLRNLEPIYDIETLIKAIPIVTREIPDARFIIVGKGSLESELKGQVEETGFMDNVRFIGFLPNEELPQYLSSMDIYVSTSLSDAGLAASTSEAMACGLPVVVTDSGENSLWIEDGDNGFVIPIRDADSLAKKIIYLMKNDDVRTRFGRLSRDVIEKKNNYYVEMRKMESIYRKSINE